MAMNKKNMTMIWIQTNIKLLYEWYEPSMNVKQYSDL
jgi:hypothetical protein